MSARGIHTNDANTSFMSYDNGGGGSGVNLASSGFTICGWMRVRGNNANDRGQVPFGVTSFLGEWMSIRDNTFDGTSPWSMEGYEHNITDDSTAATWAPATDEDWFYAAVWNSGTAQWTYYAAKDGAGSLTSVSGTAGRTTWIVQNIRIAAQHGGSYTNNVDATNVKVFLATLSSSDLFSEMNSEAPIYATTAPTLYAHWKLQNSTDTTDYGPSGRTLSATGTLTGAIMDPQDIAPSAGATCTFYGRLIA